MRTKLLKELRKEGNGNIDFLGGWSGYWITTIRGVRYISDSVSGLQYVLGNYNKFVDLAILHRVHYLKLKRMPTDEEYDYSVFLGKVIKIY